MITIDPEAVPRRLAIHPELLFKLLEDESLAGSTLSQMCATFFLSEWCASRDFPTNHPPSFLLVNTGGGDDPCMRMPMSAFHLSLSAMRPPLIPGPPRSPSSVPTGVIDEESAIKEVNFEFLVRKSGLYDKQARQPTPKELKWKEERRMEVLRAIYGSLDVGFYSSHARRDFGLGTKRNNRVCLIVSSNKDIAWFKEDLADLGSMFWNPRGIDDDYRKCAKHISIVGSIPFEQWTTDFVGDIVRGSAPILFLPHEGTAPANPIDTFEFLKIMDLIRFALKSVKHILPPPDCDSFPGWFRYYEILLRYRLRCMPPDYEFHILQLIRHIQTSYTLLHVGLGMQFPDQMNDWKDLLPKLADHAIRGIALGVESLVYHGHGIELGKHVSLTTKMLKHLRQQGSSSPRDLSRRFQSMEVGTRDWILKQLADEQLIRMDGNRIHAVPCREFLASLPMRKWMPK